MIPTIPTNVEKKNAANPAAPPISRLANHPSSPTGAPKSVGPLPAARPAPSSVCDTCSIQVEYCLMAEGVQNGLVKAAQVARETTVRRAPNGVAYAAFGDNSLSDNDLERMVQAVPTAVAAALSRKAYYFVPLALSDRRSGESAE